MTTNNQLDVNPVLAFAGTERPAARQRLVEILRIPSISTNPESVPNILRAAEWYAEQFRDIGLENVRIIDLGPGRHPLVYGDWLHADGKPTVLFYGHYDVQPAELAEGWDQDPFDPTVVTVPSVGDCIVARGSNDNKGQNMSMLEALRAFLKVHGRLPVNAKVIFEGEEEIGSTGFCAFVAKPDNHELLRADCALVADTDMATEDQGALTTWLRGLVYFDVFVRGANKELHSGLWGGKVPNPITAAANLFARVMDMESGRIRIPGFYDNIVPLPPAELAVVDSEPVNPDAECTSLGLTSLWVREGISFQRAITIEPTFELHGIEGGFHDRGKRKTAIPTDAFVKCSFRLVPGQDPTRIIGLFTQFLRANRPPGITLEIKPLGDGVHAVRCDPNTPYAQASARAFEKVTGKPMATRLSGGTIGAVSALAGYMQMPCVLAGLGQPGDAIHSKNERFSLNRSAIGTDATIYFLMEVAGL